ncbi:hypothetical protein IAQ61_000074 [Plenodomus lingam]|uniref:uncharacterized protein n=1 Tax=Leptosphaeria maculans TaxID=5022 RepID=UPI003324DEE8|nr:hypothetical protein IAQ61_000074 [Plenodomus lingam]
MLAIHDNIQKPLNHDFPVCGHGHEEAENSGRYFMFTAIQSSSGERQVKDDVAERWGGHSETSLQEASRYQ